jgi:hypothetical protein
MASAEDDVMAFVDQRQKTAQINVSRSSLINGHT